MAVALRGAAVIPTGGQANPTTGYTCTIPSQVVENDLLFLTLTSRDSTGAGSIAVSDNEAGSSWTNFAHSGTDYKLTLWWRRATSSTASKTLTVSGCVGSCSGVLKCFSGASLDAQPWADVAFETNASGDETHAGFTPSTPNAMVCCAIADYGNDDAISVGPTFATLGATTMTQCLSTGGSDCANTFGHKVTTGGSAAATGNLTWAQANNTTYSAVWTIKVNNHAATGVLTGAAGTVAGEAARSHSVAHASDGVLTGPAGALAGAAARSALHPSSGALTGTAGTLAGEARRDLIHVASGNLRPFVVDGCPGPLPSLATLFSPYPSSALVTGEAARQAPVLQHAADGALTGPGGVLAGAAARLGQHQADGALVASAAVLSGSAARQGQHAAEGALAGAAGVLAGTAAHVTGHSADGVLTGPEAVLSGEALRLAAGVLAHAAAGVLVGASGTLAGEAARVGQHVAEGVLAGGEALIAGEAALIRAHEATGDLVGAVALLAGSAARPATAAEPQIGGFYLPPGLRGRRLRITIRNGRDYEIEDLDEAETVLAEVRAEVERKVRRRVLRRPNSSPAAAVPEVTVTGAPDLLAAIAPKVHAIEAAARDYAAAETRAVLQRLQEQDDEDVLLLA